MLIKKLFNLDAPLNRVAFHYVQASAELEQLAYLDGLDAISKEDFNHSKLSVYENLFDELKTVFIEEGQAREQSE